MLERGEIVFPAVEIAGCGATTAVGSGVEALRLAVRANLSGLRPSERFAQARFQSSIVGTAPENGAGPDHDDPAFRLADDSLRQAREQARDVLATIPGER